MRTQLFIPAITIIALHISCFNKSADDRPSYKYDKMLFIRQGGGDKSFFVIPTDRTDVFQIDVNKLDFRDTTITMTLSINSANASAFNALTQTLNGMNELSGDYKQPTLPTGTWAHVYMIKGDDKKEITNSKLRDSLVQFENIVTTHLK